MEVKFSIYLNRRVFVMLNQMCVLFVMLIVFSSLREMGTISGEATLTVFLFPFLKCSTLNGKNLLPAQAETSLSV